MNKSLPLFLVLAVLVSFNGPATASTSVKSAKSNSSDRGNLAQGQFTGKVTAIDSQSRTLTVSGQGHTLVFSSAKLNRIPSVGETVSLTYTGSPGNGPLDATAISAAQSNSY